jgi:hypothetical protein
MKTIPVIASPKKPAPGAKKTHQQQTARPSSASEGSGPEPDSARILLHDAVNQLTIISLACFELNYSAAEFKNEGQRKAIDAIEVAVQAAGEVLEQLSTMLKEQSAKETNAPSSARTHPVNNVYPISPYLTRR